MTSKIVIFTDLDGTLLHNETFEFENIRQYIKSLLSKNISIIPNSSKTKAEILNFCPNPLDFVHRSNLSTHINDTNSFVAELIHELDSIKKLVGFFFMFRYCNKPIIRCLGDNNMVIIF